MSDPALLGYASEFRFKLYPEGHKFWDIAEMAVTVEWRGADRWAVKFNGFCYDVDGLKEYESIPSEREDEFKARFRFSRGEAVRVAREVVIPAERALWDARLRRSAS